MNIKNIILFSSKLGQKKNGVEKSPKYLKKFINKNNKNFHEVNCTKNIYTNLSNLYTVNKNLNYPKINIGGDHSMSISTVSDSLNKNKNVKILWFDAHPDINNEENSNTKNLHGMPLAYLSNIDYNEKFYYINNKLDLNNLMYIGIRSIDSFERKIIENKNIKYIDSYNFNNNYNKSLKKINDFIGKDQVHISFDVDCIDPINMHSTGTKSKNGLDVKNLIKVMNFLIKNKKILNIDLTELNFDLSNDKQKKKSLDTIKKIFSFLFLNH